MTKRQKAIVRRFQQVLRFLHVNPAALPPEAEEHRDRLDATVALLTAPQEFEQPGGWRRQTVLQTRSELREIHLKPLAAVARRVLSASEAANLLPPRATASPRALILAAKVIAERAEAKQQQLVHGGLAPDFMAQLHAAILSAESALRSGRRGLRRKRRDRTITTARRIEDGRRALRGLDAVVRGMVACDAPLSSQWDAASRTGRALG